jgi:electron transport complex protein RnfG
MALLRMQPGPGRLLSSAVLRLVAAACACLPGSVGAQLSQDEALALAFPGAETVERHTAYLDAAQLGRAAELAGPGVEVASGVVTYYVAIRGGVPMGVAYFDAHRVRTLPEVLMVVLTAAGTVARIETVSFREPPEYQAPEGWLRLMEGRPLEEGLSLKRDIPNLTGATLTAQAAVGAVRRVLALHAVIRPLEERRRARPSPEGGNAGEVWGTEGRP